MYTVSSYYDYDCRGLEERKTFDSWDEAVDYAHYKVNRGAVILMKNNKTGKELRFESDEYFAEFQGEFPFPMI